MDQFLSVKRVPVVGWYFSIFIQIFIEQSESKHGRECSGSEVEYLTRDRGAADSILTGVTALCPWARHINPSLVLVQTRKTRPYITKRLLKKERIKSNQSKQWRPLSDPASDLGLHCLPMSLKKDTLLIWVQIAYAQTLQ